MENEADNNKFTWVIKDFSFSSLQYKHIYSDQFIIGGCKWYLRAYPKGISRPNTFLSLFLDVLNPKSLPCGWRRHTKLRLTVVNQLSEKLSLSQETQRWFDAKFTSCGFVSMLPFSLKNAKNGGFLVNDEIKVVAEVELLEVIGRLDVTEEAKEVTQPLKKVKREPLPSTLKETVDVNGFQVLPSQVDFVKRIFEKHPDIAVGFHSKNSHLRKASMNSLLCLIETLCQPPQDLSSEDLAEADNALAYVKDAGFKVDWLEKKLDQVKEKKVKEQTSEIRMRELEKELKELKQKSSKVEALVEIEKGNVFAARASLTFDDIIMT